MSITASEGKLPFTEGQTASLIIDVTGEDVACFARLSGDNAPLHSDAAFATQAGFKAPVVHGALLASYVSQLVGMRLPGAFAVLERVDLAFRNPCYAPCQLHLTARIRQISNAVSSIVLDVVVSDGEGLVFASGKTWHRVLDQSKLS